MCRRCVREVCAGEMGRCAGEVTSSAASLMRISLSTSSPICGIGASAPDGGGKPESGTCDESRILTDDCRIRQVAEEVGRQTSWGMAY